MDPNKPPCKSDESIVWANELLWTVTAISLEALQYLDKVSSSIRE